MALSLYFGTFVPLVFVGDFMSDFTQAFIFKNLICLQEHVLQSIHAMPFNRSPRLHTLETQLKYATGVFHSCLLCVTFIETSTNTDGRLNPKRAPCELRCF